MDTKIGFYSNMTLPPAGIRLEREATVVDFNINKLPSRPITSSPMSEPPMSPLPIFSPVPDHQPPATARKPSEADTEELLQFIRHKQRNMKGLSVEIEPTASWMEKKKPLLPEIPKTPRGSHNQEGSSLFCEPTAQPGTQCTGNLLASGQSGLSRSLENIPGPNPKLLEQKRVQRGSFKDRKPVARMRSLPPIEVHMDRPSAPTPMERVLQSTDDPMTNSALSEFSSEESLVFSA